jgi:LmbE family N-acetylglucosaminyl deacetylase
LYTHDFFHQAKIKTKLLEEEHAPMDTLTNKTLTLVAFGAHPDPFDMPYQAGGTLAKYAKRGHRVILVSAAYEDEWEDEVKAIATHLGAEHRFLDFEEGAIFDEPTHTRGSWM